MSGRDTGVPYAAGVALNADENRHFMIQGVRPAERGEMSIAAWSWYKSVASKFDMSLH